MIGSRIGHYRILAAAGAGGMGIVYRAEDVNLRRAVALKVLTQTLRHDRVARERLLREARSASRLTHPHIATIYEAGESAGNLFIAMEYVEGPSLAERLQSGPTSIEEAIRVGMEVADALAAAHAHEIVHRDIKPSNILLSKDGGSKVVDFGLALHCPAPQGSADATPTETGRLTQDGFTAGTVAYMSPEQVRGETPDPRSDLFSLGVVLYETLTGRLPFRGHGPLAQAAAILHDTPAPLRELRPEIPPELEQIVLRCLAKDPARRPPNAGDFRDALQDMHRALSSQARHEVTAPRALVRLLGGAVAILAVGLVGLLVLPQVCRDRPPVETAEARRLYEQGQRYEERGPMRAQLELAEQVYRKALGVEPGNALLLAALAHVLTKLNRGPHDPARLEEACRLSQQAVATDPSLAAAWNARGWCLFQSGKDDDAIAAARRALDCDPEDWRASALLGEVLVHVGGVEPGLEEFRRGVAVAHGQAGPRIALATKLLELGRLDDAIIEYKRALEDAPGHPTALNNLAVTYLHQGRLLQSVPYFERLLKLEPDSDAASNLGTVYFMLGRTEESIRAYEQASRIDSQNPDLWRNLAEAYEKGGRVEDARRSFEYAVGVYENRLVAAAGKDGLLLARLAFCLAKLGKGREALTHAEQALALRGQDPEVLTSAAQVCALTARPKEAYGLIRRALAAGYPRDVIRLDPSFASYLSDPEFLRLLTAPAP